MSSAGIILISLGAVLFVFMALLVPDRDPTEAERRAVRIGQLSVAGVTLMLMGIARFAP